MSARRSTSLTLDDGLLREARALGINVSRAAEAGVGLAVREARTQAWREQNADAISLYNASVEADGVALSLYRKF